MIPLDVIPPGPDPQNLLVAWIVGLILVVVVIVAAVKIMKSKQPKDPTAR